MPAAPADWTLSDFDFALPPEQIAQQPAAERSASRLLDTLQAPPRDRIFRELPSLLRPGDLLVFNDTEVIKARLFGRKASGGGVELLVERVLPGRHEVWAHVRASKSPRPGTQLRLAEAFDAQVLGRCGPEDALFHLAIEGFKLGVEEVPPESQAGGDGPFIHSSHFVLVDGAGRVRGYYDSTEAEALKRLRRDLASVRSERS